MNPSTVRHANRNPRIAATPEQARALVVLDGAAIVPGLDTLDEAVEFGRAVLGDRAIKVAPQIEATRAALEVEAAVLDAQPEDDRGRRRYFGSFDQVQPAHNDGYGFGDFAPDHIFLWCDVPCPQGGASFLVDAAELLARVSADDTEFADFAWQTPIDHSEPNFPQGNDVPLARITSGGRIQVRTHPYQSAVRGPDDARHERLLSSWHHACSAARDEGTRFRMRHGDLLCIDNYRMLHGRDAYVLPTRRVVSIWSWSTSAVAVPAHALEIVTPVVPEALTATTAGPA